MSHDHFIIKCKVCEGVISQCRCMSKEKSVLWQLCDKCKSKEQAQEIADNLKRK